MPDDAQTMPQDDPPITPRVRTDPSIDPSVLKVVKDADAASRKAHEREDVFNQRFELRLDEVAQAVKEQAAITKADREVSKRRTADFAKRIDAWEKSIADRDAMLIKELMDFRSELAIIRGLSESTAVRVERLDQEKELPQEKLAELQKQLDAVRIDYDKSPDSIARKARWSERARATNERLARLESEVDDTQKFQAHLALKKVHEMEEAEREAGRRAEKARESATELIVGIVKDERMATKEERTQSHATMKWALGIIGFVVSTLLAAVAGSKYLGEHNTPPPQRPAVETPAK